MKIDRKKNTASRLSDQNHWTSRIKWFILIGITAVFTVIIYPNLVVKKHSYKLDEIVQEDIKAPHDFFIEDVEATQINQQKAVENVLTVYDHDTALPAKLFTRIERTFSDVNTIFNNTEEKEIKGEETKKNKKSSTSSGHKPVSGDNTAGDKSTMEEQAWQLKEDFESKIGIDVSDGAYKILIKEKFSSDIAVLIIEILTKVLENGVVTNKTILLRESDKGIVLRDVATKKERTVTQLKQYYGLDQAKTMVRIIGQPILKTHNYTLRNLIVDFAQRLIQPNITLNKSETEEQKEMAAEAIKPVLYQIKAGEILLRYGQRVTQTDKKKLEALDSQTKQDAIVTNSFGASLIIFVLIITIYAIYLQNRNQPTVNHNKNLLFMALVLIIFCLFSEISASLFNSLTSNVPSSITSASITYALPLASGTMLICIFMGLDVAIPFAVVLSICTAIIFQNRFDFFLYFLINNMLAAYWIKTCRERKVFIKAGAKLGLLNVVLVLAISIYMTELSWTGLLWDCAFAFMGGLIAGIVALGIAPLVEIAFDFTTDIKLLELANLDQPILRKLMLEAAGTYHHSVIVGSMVEAAASEIGANSLLAKVSGYYHDIGKIKKPLYFIENQRSGKNRHDKLAPSMSGLILMAHIKEGVEIAKKNKLGQSIIDAIKQHHGTSLISYFYDKAKLQKGEDSIVIDDFRYPGPRPQTIEIALIMLADVIEAASRTLNNPTPSRIQGLIQNQINKAFSDGQLDNCELTLKDLHSIAKSFNKIMNAIHHHRIEYPDQIIQKNGKSKNGKVKNGNPDRQQAKPTQDTPKKDSEKDKRHIKRLGQS